MNPISADLQEGVTSLDVQGTIQYVDTYGRELGVEVEGRVLVLDVPVDCTIYLREERVKLRFLQPGDHVRIACSRTDHGLGADTICVNWTAFVPYRGE